MNNSSIDICSMALNKIGAGSINSFDDGSSEAEICSSIYTLLKQKLLASHNWHFAKRSANLQKILPDESMQNSSYKYTFLLPYDLISITNIDDNCDFEIQGIYLYSNNENIKLTYTANVNESYFTPLFTSSFIYLLASELALSLLSDSYKHSMFYKLFLSEIISAKHKDSIGTKSHNQIKSFALINSRM